jgi:hypothetical protein
LVAANGVLTLAQQVCSTGPPVSAVLVLTVVAPWYQCVLRRASCVVALRLPQRRDGRVCVRVCVPLCPSNHHHGAQAQQAACVPAPTNRRGAQRCAQAQRAVEKAEEGVEKAADKVEDAQSRLDDATEKAAAAQAAADEGSVAWRVEVWERGRGSGVLV